MHYTPWQGRGLNLQKSLEIVCIASPTQPRLLIRKYVQKKEAELPMPCIDALQGFEDLWIRMPVPGRPYEDSGEDFYQHYTF